MTSPALDKVNKLLPGKGQQAHPFDWVNLPIFFDPKPEDDTEYHTRLISATKMAYVAAHEVSGGLSFVFRPSSMSNGYLAYKLAEEYAPKILQNTQARFGESFLTTQNLKRNVAGSELMTKVIFPNREEDFRSANKIESRFRDHAVIVPIEFENVPRTQRGNNALSQGATFQDWTFETWWVPRMMEADVHVQGGGRTYSRYANMEDLTADLIQCGLLDDLRGKPGKNFSVVDESGTPITMADRMWERARHIVDVTERGFRTDLAVGVLMAQFQLDDWIKTGAIDTSKVSNELGDTTLKDVERIEQLKEMMLPYIAQNCLDWADFKADPNLKMFIEDQVEPVKGKKVDAKAIMKTLLSYEPRGAFQNPDFAKKKDKSELSKRFGDVSDNPVRQDGSVKRRSTEGGYFAHPAKRFDDGHFGKLSVWEQAALPFILGAMESFRLPENAPNALFYVAEPKGGARAREYMADNGIHWLKDAYTHETQTSDSAFGKNVIAKNLEESRKSAADIAKSEALKIRKGKNVVSTHNFMNIAKAAEQLRDFVAAKGPQKLSPRARLAMMMEWMDRNPQSVALRKDWSLHHDETQLAVRAVMNTLGLVDRPIIGGETRMEIFEYNPDAARPKLTKMDFGDIFMTLGEEVRRMIDDAPTPLPGREHYVAMARMIQILDMYVDPLALNYETITDRRTGAARQCEIIAWKNIDPEFMAFMAEDPAKRQAVMNVRNNVRDMLLKVGVLYMNEEDLDGLHEEFAASWQEAQGLDEGARRRRFDGRRVVQDWNGPV